MSTERNDDEMGEAICIDFLFKVKRKKVLLMTLHSLTDKSLAYDI